MYMGNILGHTPNHPPQQGGMEKPGVKEQLLIDNELYYKNLEVGKYVFDMVTNGGIEQQSLQRNMRMR